MKAFEQSWRAVRPARRSRRPAPRRLRPKKKADACAAAGPLAGLKVVELGQLIAGPFAAQDAGATSAPSHQDRAARRGRPAAQVAAAEGRHLGVVAGAVAQQALAGARPEGRPRRRTSCGSSRAEADVLIENFRPGAMEGWGLGPERCCAINPRSIMLRISGYGQTGPYRDRPGFGVVAEAMGGLRHLTGEPGRVPVRVGVASATRWRRCTA